MLGICSMDILTVPTTIFCYSFFWKMYFSLWIKASAKCKYKWSFRISGVISTCQMAVWTLTKGNLDLWCLCLTLWCYLPLYNFMDIPRDTPWGMIWSYIWHEFGHKEETKTILSPPFSFAMRPTHCKNASRNAVVHIQGHCVASSLRNVYKQRQGGESSC